MTNTEKAMMFDRFIQIVQDQMSLEKHFVQDGKDDDAIQFIRSDAYKRMVECAFGVSALPAR